MADVIPIQPLPIFRRGRPLGTPKTGGAVLGNKCNKFREHDEMIKAATQRAFDKLTSVQMDKISCLEVWQLLLVEALDAGDTRLMLEILKDYAPYRHAKLLPRVDKDESASEIRIVGGLPTA